MPENNENDVKIYIPRSSDSKSSEAASQSASLQSEQRP
ncbi:hypothetical protein SAMN04487860_105154 [Ruminococcus flavefaciens]|uniref:Uncharacterized protein n=1 Tax=Ruminococcus flavefaciens TaxID=1265 RepID=A0A1M7J633_RUMFL|nr:hypothetical protein SAMN04487860_105154 [Ruminococcus flavefaciens]